VDDNLGSKDKMTFHKVLRSTYSGLERGEPLANSKGSVVSKERTAEFVGITF